MANSKKAFSRNGSVFVLFAAHIVDYSCHSSLELLPQKNICSRFEMLPWWTIFICMCEIWCRHIISLRSDPFKETFIPRCCCWSLNGFFTISSLVIVPLQGWYWGKSGNQQNTAPISEPLSGGLCGYINMNSISPNPIRHNLERFPQRVIKKYEGQVGLTITWKKPRIKECVFLL